MATCTSCGKVTYDTRKDARNAARALYPGERMRAYRCAAGWHIGHLPEHVVHPSTRPAENQARIAAVAAASRRRVEA